VARRWAIIPPMDTPKTCARGKPSEPVANALNAGAEGVRIGETVPFP